MKCPPETVLHVSSALAVAGVLLALTCWPQAAGAAETWQALILPSGQVEVSFGRQDVATITPGLMEATWRGGSLSAAPAAQPEGAPRRSYLRAPGGGYVDCELQATAIPGGVRLAYGLTPRSPITLNSLHVSADFPIGAVAGQEFVMDGERQQVPIQFGDVHLRSGTGRSLAVGVRGGTALFMDLEAPAPVLFQDNRQWGPTFSVRIGPQSGEGRAWAAGEALSVVFDLKAREGIEVAYDTPVTIQAGEEWVPLATELDIQPGSALDFSGMGQLDAPAGKHGWLIARPDGRLAFEGDSNTPRRFYGANFCFGALYISHDQADRLADRLARIGYNTVRVHHYEGELVDRSKGTSTLLRPDKLDQFDYLMAALKKRGIYVTTDLFVSRPVLAAEIWPGAQGDVGMDNFKMLVPVNARAFENWKAFAAALLTHVNPYTGMSYARDPALAWLSMINEGNFGNFIGQLDRRAEPDWTAAWNAFLARRYGSRQALQQAWGADPVGDPAAGTVPLYRNADDDSPRGRDLAVFLAETERDMFARMRAFLRDELGVKALLTNMNSWTNRVQTETARADYDYVDDHFYVDHPAFIERPWQLPSRCDNRSPVADGAPGGRGCAFVRLFGKPFTISEFNYSGPGRYRGVGGLLMGSLAAVQDWDVVWRFTYSGGRDGMFSPAPMGYFDGASDPLNLAAERAAICLFARGDMAAAPHAISIAVDPAEALGPNAHNVGLVPSWNALALVTRVGASLAGVRSQEPADIMLAPGWGGTAASLNPYDADAGAKLLDEMRRRGWLGGNVTDLAANRLQSETGELLVDGPRDVLVVNTPRTAGGYAREGETIDAGVVNVSVEKSDASVWASSVDSLPIAQSRRLLITHLTDLQNTGARFGERARKTLLAWGTVPHLVRAGSATVALRLDRPQAARVWALSIGGRRVAEVPAQVRDGRLVIPLNVAGPQGACMLYEVEVR